MIFALAALVAAATPLVDKCPLHVEQFMLVARGQTAHVDRYVVGLTLTGRSPVSASLAIPGLDQDILTPVIGPSPGSTETLVHYVVDLPRALAAQAIRVQGVLVHGTSEAAITCHSAPYLVSQSPRVATVDDSVLPGSDLIYPQTVTEARVVQTASAVYPGTEKQLKHEGSAIVVVTVGAQGTVIGARIEKSTGYRALDESALAAAKRLVYSEPQFAGAAIPLDYFVTYSFSAR